jgi:hypothetical protein
MALMAKPSAAYLALPTKIILEDLARTLKRPMFTGSTAKELFALTFKDEKEKLDFSVVYDVLRQL